MKRFFAFLLLLPLFVLAACNDAKLVDPVDPIKGLTREDYQDLRREAPDAEEPPPIPRLALKRDRPPLTKLGADRVISLSVTEKVPLRDVLTELAEKAGVNLELDPRISGGGIFSAKRQPFSRVLDRLCAMAGLRYSVEDSFLRIELDEPYVKSYALDYLTLIRKARSEMGIATNVFASVQGGKNNGAGEGGNGNNSTTKVETTAVADFWADIEGNVEALLANSKGTRSLRSEAGTEAKQEGLSAAKPFSLNRQAGLITIFGTQRQHEAVAGYLEKVRRSVNTQVLIEARIIEVQLDEAYRSGINWRTLFNSTFNAAARFGNTVTGAPFVAASTATDGVVTLSLNNSDFSGILNFVRSFGATRTLSSPRLTVLNNQPAVLKVARNEVYFTSTVETTPIVSVSGGTPVAVQRTVNSTPNTVPVGFLMTVQPSINPDTRDITLNLRPTVSFIVDRVEDPGVKIAAADAKVPEVTSSIPVVAVREMDSVLTMKSGSVAVMGGLMQDASGNLEKGIPYVDELPLVGNLAKSRNDTGSISELVILLRATLADSGAPAPDEADRETYHRFAHDRHPLPIKKPATKTLPKAPPIEEYTSEENIAENGEAVSAEPAPEDSVAEALVREKVTPPPATTAPRKGIKKKATGKKLSTHKKKKRLKKPLKKHARA